MKRMIIVLVMFILAQAAAASGQNLVNEVIYLKKNGVSNRIISKFVDMRINEIPVSAFELHHLSREKGRNKEYIEKLLNGTIALLIDQYRIQRATAEKLRTLKIGRSYQNRLLLLKPRLTASEINTISDYVKEGKPAEHIYNMILWKRKNISVLKKQYAERNQLIPDEGIHNEKDLKKLLSDDTQQDMLSDTVPGSYTGLAFRATSISPYFSAGLRFGGSVTFEGTVTVKSDDYINEKLTEQMGFVSPEPDFSFRAGFITLCRMASVFRNRLFFAAGPLLAYTRSGGTWTDSDNAGNEYSAYLIEGGAAVSAEYVLSGSVNLEFTANHLRELVLKNTLTDPDGTRVIEKENSPDFYRTFYSLGLICRF